jgi:formyltetrahydrofolate synthetase
MGVEADVQQGKDWLRQAAQQGVEAGCCNLIAHIANVRAHGVQAVVCINDLPTL